MEQFVRTSMFMFMLLNPFFLSVYLIELIHEMNYKEFSSVLIRGGLIAGCAFLAFAWSGDWIFTSLLQVRFSSFLVFGGLVFVIIGIRFALNGTQTMMQLRGRPDGAAGMIAMPFMIGPGTVSASVLAGSRLGMINSAILIGLTVSAVIASVLALKLLFDLIKTQHERFVTRYVEIVGRLMSLVIGTIAVELILQGIEQWLSELPAPLSIEPAMKAEPVIQELADAP